MRRAIVTGFVVLFLSLILTELLLRALALGNAPLIPYFYDSNGAARLPPNMDVSVKFANQSPVRYVTDAAGRRISNKNSTRFENSFSVRVYGDSQALGYGIEYTDTFTHKLSEKISRESKSYIEASPAIDIEQVSNNICSADTNQEKSTVSVIALNLGNDLDEAFVGGLSDRGSASSDWDAILLRYSHIYMRVALFNSQRQLSRHTVPGVNYILYALDSSERVVLARAAVEKLKRAHNCLLDSSDTVIVLIIPADVQMDPNEMEKYRSYAKSKSEFDDQLALAKDYAASMRAIENYISNVLAREGIKTIKLSVVQQSSELKASEIYFKDSHHITAEAHQLIADAIFDALNTGEF